MDGLEVETIAQKKELERLIASGDTETEKRIRSIIRKVLSDVAKKLSNDAKSVVPNDPRKAYKAVKHAVYRKILGGNVSLLNRKRKGNIGSLPVSSSKRKASQRTIQLNSYVGADRGFILRFLNSGTEDRCAKKTYNNKALKDEKYISDARRKKKRSGGFKSFNPYNRGSIKARHFFGVYSQRRMEQASEFISHEIDKYIREEFSG